MLTWLQGMPLPLINLSFGKGLPRISTAGCDTLHCSENTDVVPDDN